MLTHHDLTDVNLLALYEIVLIAHIAVYCEACFEIIASEGRQLDCDDYRMGLQGLRQYKIANGSKGRSLGIEALLNGVELLAE